MRAARRLAVAVLPLLVLGACARTPPSTESTVAQSYSAEAVTVMRIVADTMAHAHLRAVIVRVTVDGRELVTEAPLGESMTGRSGHHCYMHFRNGAVAISYVSTLLLQLAEEGTLSLDDTLARWLPEVPHSDRVSLRRARPDDLRIRSIT